MSGASSEAPPWGRLGFVIVGGNALKRAHSDPAFATAEICGWISPGYTSADLPLLINTMKQAL
jgi:hypothetical protein